MIGTNRTAFLPFALAIATIGTPFALGADQRDVVFKCPCSAEWVATGSGNAGELTLHFGVRNFRASETGELRVSFAAGLRVSRYVTGDTLWRELSPASWPPVGSCRARSHTYRPEPYLHRCHGPAPTIQSWSSCTSALRAYRRERAEGSRSARGADTRG